MNIYPSFNGLRTQLSHKFFTLRTDALRDSLWAKLTGRTTQLAGFPDESEKSLDRIFIGTEYIPTEQIIGTMNRQRDFDHRFRPLNRDLRDRWVNVYLTLERDGWSPILVHKFGDHYYVEDGHYRVSIAQMLGIMFIRARVWEYSRLADENCEPAPCPESRSTQAYAGVTD